MGCGGSFLNSKRGEKLIEAARNGDTNKILSLLKAGTDH